MSDFYAAGGPDSFVFSVKPGVTLKQADEFRTQATAAVRDLLQRAICDDRPLPIEQCWAVEFLTEAVEAISRAAHSNAGQAT